MDDYEKLAWQLFNAGEKLANTMRLIELLSPQLDNTGLEEMNAALEAFRQKVRS